MTENSKAALAMGLVGGAATLTGLRPVMAARTQSRDLVTPGAAEYAGLKTNR